MYSKLVKFLNEKKVKLVAVSKTRPDEKVIELYDQGQRILGENRVSELVRKSKYFPTDIEWHMIGHLQSKKVKSIISIVHMIHSVDTVKLYDIISREAKKIDETINILLQVKIGQEEAKYGLNTAELKELINLYLQEELSNVNICGLMGMASFVEDQNQVKSEFKELKTIFDECKSKYFSTDNRFKELSMGMSGDYKLAIEEGATIVRIGSLLF